MTRFLLQFFDESADAGLSLLKRRRPSIETVSRDAALAALRYEKARGGGLLNVIWADQRRVRVLNRRFRRTDRFTDVISFRYEDAPPSAPRARGPLPFGDLYISVTQARMNAARFNVSLAEELLRLVVHGTLHLLGHTDYTPGPKKKMWAVQEKIVARYKSRLPSEGRAPSRS